MRTARPPAVAGSFFFSFSFSSGSSDALAREVDAFLTEVTARTPSSSLTLATPIAATADAQLARRKPLPTRVILLGPSHHVAFSGLALPGCDTFETPLGVISLDENALVGDEACGCRRFIHADPRRALYEKIDADLEAFEAFLFR